MSGPWVTRGLRAVPAHADGTPKDEEADVEQPEKQYLGDAVYALMDRWGRVTLTTEDGYRATNIIILEPEVLEALDRFVRHARAKSKKP